MNVSAETARRYLVARHLLAPARSVAGGIDGVRRVFRRLGSVQFDPLAVAGRNHDLVLHARVADYDPAWCEELLYVRRELFEAYNKGLSLLPTSELPWFRHSWRIEDRYESELLVEHAELAEQVLARIRAEGPMSTLDFERGPSIEWWWAPTNAVRAVLETYAVGGVLGLARRQGNRRYYDFIERLFPAELLAHEVPARETLTGRLGARVVELLVDEGELCVTEDRTYAYRAQARSRQAVWCRGLRMMGTAAEGIVTTVRRDLDGRYRVYARLGLQRDGDG